MSELIEMGVKDWVVNVFVVAENTEIEKSKTKLVMFSLVLTNTLDFEFELYPK